MSIGDIVILEQNSLAGRGASTFNVGAGATTINPGEPVMYGTGGNVTVQAAGNNFPVNSSDYFVGIASTTSTQTSGTAGTVGVYITDSRTIWLIKAKVATSWDTQAEYDALVGKSVLIDLTSGAYTLLATNAPINGVIVAPLDVNKYPGRVAIQFKANTLYTR